MPRPPRTWLPEVTYHCYSRCIEMRNLLSEKWVIDLALEVINITLEKYDFQLIQLNFVENHFHFKIRTVEGGENISRIMQYIKSRIAEGYNRKMGRSGPFWNDRFKCKIIELAKNPEQYFFNSSLYIGYNTVVKGIHNDPRDSSYNTFRAFIDPDYKSPVPITFHPYYLALGKNHKDRIGKFLIYEQNYRNHLKQRSLIN